MYAVLHNASVVNVSLGLTINTKLSEQEQFILINNAGKMSEKAWAQIFKWAETRNCIIVWAAGNSTIISGVDPTKRNESTVRVSALNTKLERAHFSNYGDNVGEGYNCFSTISAPGVNIYSAAPGNQYMFSDGTSMAAPIVTGAIALMKSLDKGITADQAIKVLRETGKPIAKGNIGPMLQIADALNAVKEGFLDFDDVIDNPEALIGKWRSTGQLFNTITGCPVTLYFEFTSTKSGIFSIVERYDDSPNKTYSSKISVKISDRNIMIEQLGVAGHYIKYKFECSPDSDGKMSVLATPENNYDAIKFNLVKEE